MNAHWALSCDQGSPALPPLGVQPLTVYPKREAEAPSLTTELESPEYHSTAFVWSKESVGPGRTEGKRETDFIF